MSSNQSANNAYLSLYRALLWGNEKKIRECAQKYGKSRDPRPIELACGLMLEPNTPWYRLDIEINQFLTNLWMRYFRKSTISILLTEGYIINEKTKDICKPIIRNCFIDLKNHLEATTEITRQINNLIDSTASLNSKQDRDDFLSCGMGYAKKLPANPTTSLEATEQVVEGQQPVSETEQPSAVTPVFEASSKIKSPYVPPCEPRETMDNRSKPHDPAKSTKTAESHYLDLSKPD